MSEEQTEPRRRLQLQWVVGEGSPEAEKAFAIEQRHIEIEIEKLARQAQSQEIWQKDRDRTHALQERSHQAWVEKNDKALELWERIASALEEMAARSKS